MKEWMGVIRQMMGDIGRVLEMEFGPRKSRALKVTGAGCVGSTVIGIGKLLMGIFSLSFFTCISAFYTFGMAAAKACTLAGFLRPQDQRAQYRYCRLAGKVLAAASCLYVLYTVRLLWLPGREDQYHMYVAIGIAAFTFYELGISLYGVLAERKNHLPLFHTLKTINLASALICLVLTQRSLLSFAAEAGAAIGMGNILIGVLTGVAATLLGLGLIRRMKQMEMYRYTGPAGRKIRRLIRRERMAIAVSFRYYCEREGHFACLGVVPRSFSSPEQWDLLRRRAWEQCRLEIVDAQLHPLVTILEEEK